MVTCIQRHFGQSNFCSVDCCYIKTARCIPCSIRYHLAAPRMRRCFFVFTASSPVPSRDVLRYFTSMKTRYPLSSAIRSDLAQRAAIILFQNAIPLLFQIRSGLFLINCSCLSFIHLFCRSLPRQIFSVSFIPLQNVL